MKLSLLLAASSLSSPSAVAAYFAQANNAHVEFVSLSSSSSSSSSETESSSSGGVDEDDEWKALLQPKLQEKLDQLNYHLSSDEEGKEEEEDNDIVAVAAPSSTSSGTSTAAAHSILNLFEEWTRKFDKEYESLYERGNKLLVWAENHGEKRERGFVSFDICYIP